MCRGSRDHAALGPFTWIQCLGFAVSLFHRISGGHRIDIYIYIYIKHVIHVYAHVGQRLLDGNCTRKLCQADDKL